MNGDGRKDIVAFGIDGDYVSLNMSLYFGDATKWSNEFGSNTGWNSTKHLGDYGEFTKTCHSITLRRRRN
jgi:hypothetical protein